MRLSKIISTAKAVFAIDTCDRYLQSIPCFDNNFSFFLKNSTTIYIRNIIELFVNQISKNGLQWSSNKLSFKLLIS